MTVLCQFRLYSKATQSYRHTFFFVTSDILNTYYLIIMAKFLLRVCTQCLSKVLSKSLRIDSRNEERISAIMEKMKVIKKKKKKFSMSVSPVQQVLLFTKLSSGSRAFAFSDLM